ncbi:MAG: hypothetical protein ACRDMX_09675 [Solirubrobacteraceae bacterium]
MPLVFADGFLTASLLSILMPVLLLIALAYWYLFEVARQPGKEPESLTAQEASALRTRKSQDPSPGTETFHQG